MAEQIQAISTNKFHIGISNDVPDPYDKNGNHKLGGYSHRQQYCWEALAQLVDSLPSNITVTSVTCDVNITSYNAGSIEVPLELRVQDGGSWNDDPGNNEPSRSTPSFFNSHGEWANKLSQINTPVYYTGVLTIPSSTALVAWVQGVVDGTITNDGLMVCYYPDYYGYWIESDHIEFTLEYDSKKRRRVMVIS